MNDYEIYTSIYLKNFPCVMVFGNRKSNYLCVYCFNKNFFVDSQEVQGYKIKIKKVGLVHTFM